MTLELKDPIEKVPLIGPSQGQKLKRLVIYTVEDLLNHYPFRYLDYSAVKKIADLLLGESVTIKAKVEKIENIYTREGRGLTKARLRDETGSIEAVWFNQPYLVETLKVDTLVNLAGQVEGFSGRPTFPSPDYEILPPGEPSVRAGLHTARLVPVYSETYGISSKWLRSRIGLLLNSSLKIEDNLPTEIKLNEGLCNLVQALRQIHFPESSQEIETAKKRLSFDEVLKFQLVSQLRRLEINNQRSNAQIKTEIIENKIKIFIRNLPFELTLDQLRSVSEILKDLSKTRPMNRLLQGDVGSGKTVVAAIASYALYLSGYSTLYMAPTEILAHQHYQTFQKLFRKYDVEIGLITSSTRKNPEFKIVIGTHALLHSWGEKGAVGLVIIDEQHKFGVEQRAKLLEPSKKGSVGVPHLLSMTATPIPRTLSLTFLGDLDLSTISQMPKERKPAKTWLIPKEKRAKAYDWIKKQITTNTSQVYVVCPFIEESENETLKSVKAATVEFKKLQTIFTPFKIALLHGKLKSQEKETIMKDFMEGEIDILVSTPVVEVGIDNPNVDIILIEGSERFGLASLHQLRGRVGRGQRPSFCLLFTESNSPLAIDRLKSLQKTSSGLELSEIDLKNRGMGNFLGTDQSGFLKTKIADLSDLELIKKVNAVATTLLNSPNYKEKIRVFTSSLNQGKKIHLD